MVGQVDFQFPPFLGIIQCHKVNNLVDPKQTVQKIKNRIGKENRIQGNGGTRSLRGIYRWIKLEGGCYYNPIKNSIGDQILYVLHFVHHIYDTYLGRCIIIKSQATIMCYMLLLCTKYIFHILGRGNGVENVDVHERIKIFSNTLE